MTSPAPLPDPDAPPLTRRQAKALRAGRALPAPSADADVTGRHTTLPLPRRELREIARTAPSPSHRGTPNVPSSRREAKAQRPSHHPVAGPVAPALTAVALLLGATGAAATSGNLDSIPKSQFRADADPSPRTAASARGTAVRPPEEQTSRAKPRQALGTKTAPPVKATPPVKAATTPTPPPPVAVKPKPVRPAWVSPVKDYYVSSNFGWRWGRLHSGIDMAGPEGQPVMSVGAGTVIDAGYEELRGNAVYIRHPDGTETVYAHMQRIDVEIGERVDVGEQIGLLGNTGFSTGPHLHFEVHPDGGDAIDPAPWLEDRGLL